MAAETNSDTLKIGVIGCGGRSGADVPRMLAGNENVKLVALADLFQDRLDEKRTSWTNYAKEVSSKVDIKDDHCFVGWDAYQKILETDIDIVMHTAAAYCRPQHIEAAVNAKKHIFVEKPIATDPAGVRQFLAAVKKHKEMGLSLVCGTQFRHDGVRQQTMKKIHDGVIGDVVALRSFYCGGVPWTVKRREGWSEVEYQVRNWLNWIWGSGDFIVEQAVHGIDHCNWVMGGPPESVFASGGRNWKPRTEEYGDMYDHFSCDFTYKNGVHLAQYCRHWDGADGAGNINVVGTKGISNGVDMGDWKGDMTMQEHQDLIASIRKTGAYQHEGERIANSTLTAMMGRISAYTGKRISFKQALEMDLKLVPDNLSFDTKLPEAMIPVAVNLKNAKPPR